MTHKQKVLNACDKLLSYIHALEYTLLTDRQDKADLELKKDIDELRKQFGESVERYKENKEELLDQDIDDDPDFDAPMFAYD